MVKVLDPIDRVIIGVYDSEADVPSRIADRMFVYWFPREDCEIIPVIDPKEQERLLPSLRKKDE